jgi:alkanesulfonate monooxygenase SsuD/methylene tetrahydromethanopterin reductase-like flavin-dependent oxidoreductase (luciferase family)
MHAGTRAPTFGFKVASPSTDWPGIEAIFRRGAELPVFTSAWTNDHLQLHGPTWDGLTSLAALAHLVPDHTIGHLVLATPFRHIGVIAKSAVVLDHATRGRFVLGLGVGSWPGDFEVYGIPLPSVGDRLRVFESELRVLHALFGRPGAIGTRDADGLLSVADGPIQLTGVDFDPAPFTPGGPPIWLGTQGERVGLRLAAQYADGWNFSGEGDAALFTHKLGVLRSHAERLERDPSTLAISAQLVVGKDLAALRDEVVRFLRAGCEHVIFYLDVAAGVRGLERVATEVAEAALERAGA